MAITRVQGTGAATGTSNTAAATLSATPTAGNLLVAFVYYKNGTTTIASNNGYTSLGVIKDAGVGAQTAGALYYKIAGAGETTTPSWDLPGAGSMEWICGIEEWYGLHPSTPADVDGGGATAGSTSFVCGSAVNPTDSKEMLVIMGFGSRTAISWSAQATDGNSITERWDTTNTISASFSSSTLTTGAGTYSGTATASSSDTGIGLQAFFIETNVKTLAATPSLVIALSPTISAITNLAASPALALAISPTLIGGSHLLSATLNLAIAASPTLSALTPISATLNLAISIAAPTLRLSPGPDVFVEVAFSTNPGATPVWVNISDYVVALSIRRGRQHELDRDEAGTLSLLLRNDDGRFNPNNASGPYYPNIYPMRQVRVYADYGKTIVGNPIVRYQLFRGFIEGWPQTYQGELLSTVEVTAVDGFKVLSLTEVSGSFAEELSSTRVDNVLNVVGWPAADRSIATGRSLIQAVALEAVGAKEHLDTVVASENGRLFIAADGTLTFHSRHTAAATPYDTVQVALAESGSYRYLEGLVFSFDDANIYNNIHMTREGGEEQEVNDATSVARYYTRSRRATGLLVTTDNEAYAAGEFLLARYKAPTLRPLSVEISPEAGGGSMWPYVLNLDLGQRVSITRTPPGSAAITQQAFIEGIEHQVPPGVKGWRTTWTLSPIGVDQQVAPFWVLGTAALGSGTRWSY